MNTKYNYLIGSDMGISENYNIAKRPDPDTDGCKKLYDDIVVAYFSAGKINKSAIEVREQQFKYNKQNNRFSNEELWNRYELLNNNNQKAISSIYKPPLYTIVYKEFFLSSDYIGPSIYWASKKVLSSKKILEILNKCRTIGGHIVWPRGNGETINQARSGEKGFYDRIDWTLFVIKQFCDNDFSENETHSICLSKFGDKYINPITKVLESINRYKTWFKEFGDYSIAFVNFCKQFKLEGCFVNEKYDVNWFAPPIPFLPDDYELFAENNISAIEKRNNHLE